MNADALKPTPVPSAFEIREIFQGLLGREVTWEGTSHHVDPLDGAVCGVYTDDFGNLAAIILADVPLVAWAGSAIALLPIASAEKSVEDNLVTPGQFDNFTEILNVASSMFNKRDTPHLKLHETYAPRETLPADAEKWVFFPASRIDGTLSVQGYGEGRISVVVAY
jgi:hypothetical protein